MRLNKILLVSLILLAILSIGAVSAVDDESSILAADDTADVLSADSYDKSIYVDTAGSDSNTGSSSSPFATLNKALSEVNASQNTAIYLKAGEYSGENNTNLVIDLAHLNYNGTLTIIGDSNGGTILDGGDEASIIYSISADSIVTLKNIAFMNGKRDMGSAIRSSGDLTIDSCIFESNEATNLAAVYQDKANNLTIINSKFLNNKANQYADLYFSQNALITLINNVFDGAVSASSYAYSPGVSIQTGKSIIKGNTFKNLQNSYYAILYVTYNNGANTANITDNVFMNCSYTGSNGALLYVQNAYLKNNTFVDCTTNTAAVYANTDINAKVVFDDANVTGTNFDLTATVTDVDGNLVKNANVIFTIDGKQVGQAKSGNDGVAKLTISKLLENGKYTISGTQSYSTSTPNPFEVSVTDATATVNFDHSPAEYWVSTTGNDTSGDGSKNNPFLTLEHALDVGTAATVDLTVHVMDGLYKGSSNYALSYSNVGKITIVGESYGNAIIDVEHAKSGWSGAQIFVFGQYVEATLINLTMVNCDSNVVNAYTLTMKDCLVINSSGIRAQSGNDGVLIDGLTFINGKGQVNLYNAEIYNSNFINCNGGTSTGLLWLASNNDYVLHLENNTFYNNTIAGSSGGSAYYIQGNLVSINNIFDSNTVTGTSANYVAYASANKITSINDQFVNNNVTNYVVQYRSSGANPEIIVENITVMNNFASGNGAGLSTTGAKIKNGKFINNTASGNGGAIYLLNHGTTAEVVNMSIEGTTFENNNAKMGNDLFIAPGAGSNVFANLGNLTITANDLKVTELSGTLVVSVDHPSGAIIGGGQVKFYLDDNLVGKADLINQNATFEYIGFENNTVYNFTAVYEYASENDTYVAGIVSTNITSALDSVELYVSDLNGDDNNNGSKNSPFKTISKALSEGYKLSTNVTVHVLEGTYAGELNTKLDVPTTIYLTIAGEGRNKTIISDDTADYFLTILAGNKMFTLANMTLNRAARDTQSAIYVEEGALATIDNVEFLAGQGNYGGAINTAGILLINNAYFFDNGYFDIAKRANAYYGGAIYNDGTLIIDNTTFEGNHAGRLSTISTQGELYMYNSNVIDNINAYSMNMDLIAIGAFGGQKGNITIVNTTFKVTNRTIDEINGGHVYDQARSLSCLAIGSCENVYVYDSTFVNEGAVFAPYVFSGINSWNLASGGYTLVTGDVYAYNTTFSNVQAVSLFYSRTDGMSYHSNRVFEGCLFDNVEYVIAALNTGNFSVSISDSVILGDNIAKIGIASGKTLDMDISNNWWGTNNATYANATIGTTNYISNSVLKLREISSETVAPENYLILALNATNKTGLLQDVTLAFKVTDGENVTDYEGTLYPREFTISATNGTLAQKNGTIDSAVIIPFEGTENEGYYVEATVDNQTVNLTVEDKLALGNATILAEDVILYFNQTQFNVTVLDGDKKANVGKLTLRVTNGIYEADIIDGIATFNIPAMNQGSYALDYSIGGDKIFNPATNSSTLFVVYVVTNETFYDFFTENGTLKDEIVAEELTFAGEFSDLVDMIVINKPLYLLSDNATLNNIAMSIIEDCVTVDGFNFVSDNLSNVLSIIDVDNVAVKNSKFDTSGVDNSNNAVITISGSNDVHIMDNEITFTAPTNGTYKNTAISADASDSLIVSNNTITAAIPSRSIDWGTGTVYSEGVGLNDCDNAVLENNIISVQSNDKISTYDTIYAVDVKGDNASVIDNEINVTDAPYGYALVVTGKDFVIDGNKLTAGEEERYACGIDIESNSKGVINNNTITVKGDSAYAIYTANWGGDVKANITNNNIVANGITGFAMSLSGSEAIVDNNTIYMGGNFSTGIASKFDMAFITNNTILILASDEGTPVGTDSMGIETTGVHIVSGDALVKENKIAVTGKYAVDMDGTGAVTDNELVTELLKGDFAVDYKQGSGVLVANNTPEMELNNTLTNDTFYVYFDEEGKIREQIDADNLTFIGEFSDLVDMIDIDRPIALLADNATLKDIAMFIESDNVTVDGFIFDAENLINVIEVCEADNVTIANSEFYVTGVADSDNVVIAVVDSENTAILNNKIYFDADTNGTHLNAAIRAVESDNLTISSNEINANIPSRSINWTSGEVYSVGVDVADCDNAVLDNNTIGITSNDKVATYDTIYAVSVTGDNASVTDNEITVSEAPYGYALVIAGEDFVIDGNKLTAGENESYACGIEVDGNSNGIINDNEINVKGDSVYGIYTANWAGDVKADITNNNIETDGITSFGMSLSASEALVENNTISSNGNFTTGIASKVANITINNNTIIDNASDEGTPAGYDSMGIETTGIHIVSGNATVTNNDVKTNGEFAVDAKGTGSVTDNSLFSKEYTGDAAVDCDPNNTAVANNTPEMTRAVINAEDIVMYYKNGTRYVIILSDQFGNPLANKTVTLTINGASYNRTTDANGTASLAINLGSGNYTASASFIGVDGLSDASIENNVTILSTVYGDDIVKVFKNGTQYYATFLDGQGNPLANGTEVTFNINGVMYKRYVNGTEGKARLNINLPQGEYIITAINPENGEMHANNITVLPSIVNNTDLVKYYRNDSQYYVTIIGDDGNPVGENVTVKFNINGVFYERKTNASGVARLNINLEPGDYIITAEYNDCRVSNNITVLPVLNATDLTKKYGTADQFVATLVNGTGAPYAGQNVTFNINGVFYQRTTDAQGNAKLNINLMAGEYIITSSYNGANIANHVTVTA